MQLPERLVEAKVANGPRGEGHDEAIERIDLAGVAERRSLVRVPAHRVELAAADLGVAMGE